MTTITLSPIKRSYTSPNLKKHCHPLSTPIITGKQQNLPDLLNDIFIEQQQRQEMIMNIAKILRKVGDQMDEQLQIQNNSSSSSDRVLRQRTILFINSLSHVLRFFL